MDKEMLEMLTDGDLRRTGAAQLVASEVVSGNKKIEDLVELLDDNRPGVRMRSADALEKICRVRPEMVAPFKDKFMRMSIDASQQEVQWHLAQMLGSFPLSSSELKDMEKVMMDYFEKSKSNIVRVSALTALANWAKNDEELKLRVKKILERTTEEGTASIKARSRILLKVL